MDYFRNKSSYIIGLLLIVIAFLLYKHYWPIQPRCNFEIDDIKEYKGQYGTQQNYYIVYEGIIRNKSRNSEFLNAMIGKVYNKDGVEVSSGYTKINDWIDSGKAIPFKVHTTVDLRYDTEMRQYFSIEERLTRDIYPWFKTCR